MSSVVLGLRVLLAAIFATAAVGKVLDRPGSRAALAAFGVPERALWSLAVLLPAAELATAAALLTHEWARWGGVAALILLVTFIAGIARAMSLGQAPDCHCFGQIRSAPAGRATLTRNAVLAVMAAVVAWRGAGSSIGDLTAGRTGTEVAAVTGCVSAALLAGLSVWLWSHRRALERELVQTRAELAALPPGLPIGVPAPGFALKGINEETLTLAGLCALGRPVVLVFISPNCAGCRALLPDLGRWQAALAEQLTIAVLSIGSAADNRPAFEEHAITNVMLQDELEVMRDYRLQATPAAIVVSAQGTIASAAAAGATAIEPLVRLTVRRGASSSTARSAAA